MGRDGMIWECKSMGGGWPDTQLLATQTLNPKYSEMGCGGRAGKGGTGGWMFFGFLVYSKANCLEKRQELKGGRRVSMTHLPIKSNEKNTMQLRAGEEAPMRSVMRLQTYLKGWQSDKEIEKPHSERGRRVEGMAGIVQKGGSLHFGGYMSNKFF